MAQPKQILVICCLAVLILFMVSTMYNKHIKLEISELSHVPAVSQRSPGTKCVPCAKCTSMVPCSYNNEVDLRILVLTYDRVESFAKCLQALQEADYMGASVSVEIWIDISKEGKVNQKMLNFANSFEFKHGCVCVHVQTKHVNVAFQWIYSWQPKPNTKEIGVIIEDDVDVSKYFYRYLKSAREFYVSNREINGICLNDQNCQISKGGRRETPLKRPTGKADIVFLYGLFCTWGYAPDPGHWRKFQDWYHNNVSKIPDFDPTVKDAQLQSGWYWIFKKRGKADTMLHEMYLIKYSHDHKLYTLHPNLQVLVPRPLTGLTSNRKEKGLHFHGKADTKSHHLQVWKDDFTKFPKSPLKYNWDGTLL